MKPRIVFIFVLCSINLFSQLEISLNHDLELIVDKTVFKNGELGLKKFKTTVNSKYKTKRLRSPEVRFYHYCFKKLGLYLESSDFERPSDKCRSLTLIFQKKGKKVFAGSFFLLGNEIKLDTSFENIFYNKELEFYINKELNQSLDKLYKGLIQFRLKGYIITIRFGPFGKGVREVEINSFSFDPEYKDIRT